MAEYVAVMLSESFNWKECRSKLKRCSETVNQKTAGRWNDCAVGAARSND